MPNGYTIPAISVLMTVYNAYNHVGSAIDSILNQTFCDFEFIIVDDGSTDKTASLIENYSKTDRRIRLISTTNFGQTSALNTGLTYCRAKYIARQDADDASLRHRLETQYRLINADDDRMLVGSRAIYMRGDKIVHRPFKRPPTNPQIVRRHLQYRNVFIHTSLMFRRVVQGNSIFYEDNLQIAQDFELITRLSKFGSIINLKEKLVVLQLGEDSSSKGKSHSQQDSAITIALSSVYPELSYLKSLPKVDLPTKLNDLKSNRLYSHKLIFLDFYYGRVSFSTILRTLDQTLFLIICKNIDLVLITISNRFRKKLNTICAS